MGGAGTCPLPSHEIDVKLFSASDSRSPRSRPMIGRFPGCSRPAGGPKPRVLLVDDHRGVLDQLTRMLSDTFEVAGVATDGQLALEIARQLTPDLIVLDINMPGLDGFQTLRALQQAGSRAPTVFLSMHDAQEIVTEAFRCGGRGYVLKSNGGQDLASAIDHALAGRMFVPSLTSMLGVAKRSGHAMQTYGPTD